MSFGFGLGDFILIINLAKDTAERCKNAPAEFAEAGRSARLLHIVLESIELEVKNPVSVFHRDRQHTERFLELLQVCKDPLARLDDILIKYGSLGSSKKKAFDRLLFPKKDVLDIQGLLGHRTSNLSAFLDTIGLGSIGRVEAKLDGVRDVQEKILAAVDKVFAQSRSEISTASTLSHHSDDDKLVWKTLRSELIAQGFTSNQLVKHEQVIKTKLLELMHYGLWDSEVAFDSRSDGSDTTVLGVTKSHVGNWDSEVSSNSGSEGSGSTVSASSEPQAFSHFRPSTAAMLSSQPSDVLSGAATSHSKGRSGAPVVHSQTSLLIEYYEDGTPPLEVVRNENKLHFDHSGRLGDGRLLTWSSPTPGPAGTSSPASLEEQAVDPGSLTGSEIKHRAVPLPQAGPPKSFPKQDVPRNLRTAPTIASTNVGVAKLSHRSSPFRLASMPRYPEPPSIYAAGPSVDADPSSQGQAFRLPHSAFLPPSRQFGQNIPTLEQRRQSFFQHSGFKAQFVSQYLEKFHIAKLAYCRPWTISGGGGSEALHAVYSGCNQDYVYLVLRQSGEEVIVPVADLSKIDRTFVLARQNRVRLEREARRWVFRFTGDISNGCFTEYWHIDSMSVSEKMTSTAAKGDVYGLCRLLQDCNWNFQGLMPGLLTQPSQPTGVLLLHEAASRNELIFSMFLLENGVDPNATLKLGKKVLQTVVEKGFSNMTRLLLEYDASPQTLAPVSEGGHPVLTIAAKAGNLTISKILLDYGAQVDKAPRPGETALYAAASQGHASVVKLLLRNNATPSTQTDIGRTPLYKACARGYTDVVVLLLESGADADTGRGQDGETCLYKAAYNGHTRTVKALLQSGADPNIENDNLESEQEQDDRAREKTSERPIHAAAQQGHVKILQMLLRHGADRGYKGHSAAKAKRIAVAFGRDEVIKVLSPDNR